MSSDFLAGKPCLICGQQGRARITVHSECIVHAHDAPVAPDIPRPRRQEEWAALYTENERLRRGLQQIVEGDYPAEAIKAETWAAEVLADSHAVEWGG